jgi:hypothetical protein
MMYGKKKGMAWCWIIISFILFWPLGLFLLLRRIAYDRSLTLNDGKTVAIISYLLIGIGFICLAIAVTDDSGLILPAVLFGAGGIWVNRLAKRMTVTGERYKKYILLIANQNQTSIDDIASVVGVSYEEAVADLLKMIETGYFSGAYIAQRKIVLAHSTTEEYAPPEESTSSPAQPQIKVVTCSGCGANNRVIVDQIVECEYCGKPLQ